MKIEVRYVLIILGAVLAGDGGHLDAGHLKFVDPNIVATNYDLIKQGKYTAAVLQTPQDDAEFSLKVAVKVAESVNMTKENYLPTPMLTKNNVDQYPRPIEQRLQEFEVIADRAVQPRGAEIRNRRSPHIERGSRRPP